MIWMGLAILLYGWAHFGFRDLGGLRSSAIVHGLVQSWLILGYLRDGKFWGETFVEFFCF